MLVGAEVVDPECRLLGNGRERGVFLLGLDHPERKAVDEEQIIAAAGIERDFAERDTAGGGGIESLVVLVRPTRGDEERVDFFAGNGFG